MRASFACSLAFGCAASAILADTVGNRVRAAAKSADQTLTGRIEDGVECLRLRLPDGRAVSLQAGIELDRSRLTPGTSVSVVAVPMRMSTCMQGPAYQVRSLDIVEPR